MNVNKSTQSVNLIQLTDEQFALFQELLETLQAQQEKEDNLLTVSHTANILGVSRATLHRWNESGYLKKTKIGSKTRYHEADVIAIKEARQ